MNGNESQITDYWGFIDGTAWSICRPTNNVYLEIQGVPGYISILQKCNSKLFNKRTDDGSASKRKLTQSIEQNTTKIEPSGR